eukprot:superscaffoldBa00000321_g3784
MATQFSIDDAFVLEGDEEGAVSDGEPEGWKSREKDREGGEMTFGPLSFSKPQSHPSPAAAGSPEHSNLKYQNLENEDALGNNGNSSFNNFFKIRGFKRYFLCTWISSLHPWSVPCDIHQLRCPRKKRLQIVLPAIF